MTSDHSPLKQSSRNVPPQITTVIPTYRRPRLLARAIQSVLLQDYPEFEVHVYDNASGDETRSVVEHLAAGDSRIRYYCNPSNIGLWPNFVLATSRVATPFLHILSDDDIILPGLFENAIRTLSEYPEAAVFMGSIIEASTSGDVLDVPIDRYKHGLLRPPEGLSEIIRKGHTTWPGFVFRREAFDSVGGLDEQVGEPGDVDIQFRIAAQYPVFVSPSPAAVFFSHPGQASALSRNMDESVMARKRIIHNLNRVATLGEREKGLARDIVLGRLRRQILREGGEAAARGCYREAKQATQILAADFGDPSAGLYLTALTAAARIIPSAVTRFLIIVSEQVQRVVQKRRYGLGSRISRSRRDEYTSLVQNQLRRLEPAVQTARSSEA